MTGKRFSVTQTILGSGIYDYQAEDELCESYDEDAYGEVCNLLNELHEEKEDMQGEIDHCHRIIETLVAQKGVTDYMDLLNLCDKDILIENGWEIWEEEE